MTTTNIDNNKEYNQLSCKIDELNIENTTSCEQQFIVGKKRLHEQIVDLTTENNQLKLKVVTLENMLRTQIKNLEVFNFSKFKSYESDDGKIEYLKNCDLNKKCKMNVYDNDICYPIEIVCFKSTLNCVKIMFDVYNELHLDVRCKNVNNFELLHYVCIQSTPDVAKFVLDYYIKKNFDIDCKNNQNKTPLHYICERNNSEIIKYFFEKYVEHNCDFNSVDLSAYLPINYINPYNWTIELLDYLFLLYHDRKYNFNYYPANNTYVNSSVLCKIFNYSSTNIIKRVFELHLMCNLDIETSYTIINKRNSLMYLLLTNNKKNVTSELIVYIIEYYSTLNRDLNSTLAISTICEICNIATIKLLFDKFREKNIIVAFDVIMKCYKIFYDRLNEDMKAKIFTLYSIKNVLNNCIYTTENRNNDIDCSKYCNNDLFYEIINICFDDNYNF